MYLFELLFVTHDQLDEDHPPLVAKESIAVTSGQGHAGNGRNGAVSGRTGGAVPSALGMMMVMRGQCPVQLAF